MVLGDLLGKKGGNLLYLYLKTAFDDERGDSAY